MQEVCKRAHSMRDARSFISGFKLLGDPHPQLLIAGEWTEHRGPLYTLTQRSAAIVAYYYVITKVGGVPYKLKWTSGSQIEVWGKIPLGEKFA